MSKRHLQAFTIAELVVTMACLSLFLAISAQVVTRYFHAYRQMDSSLPSQRSLCHNLEFLMRYLSTAQIVLEPDSKKLKEGFSPNWSEDESDLFRVKLLEADGQEKFSSIGYSASDKGLLLLEYPVVEDKLGEPLEQFFQTGPMEVQTVQTGRKTLLRIRLYPDAENKLPVQSVICLSGLLFEPLASEEQKK